MSGKPKCFIIMPLTTPENYLEAYRGDVEHFLHVLERLFIPAIEQAGFEPIKPIAKGSENIQALIIKKLETSDLVFCDMSLLNPNVFFEFGIRTSLNKPICLVVDDKTPKIPFDPGTINHHKYNSSMLVWDVEREINKIVSHIIESKEQLEDGNPLWKYFGISNVAIPVKPKSGEDGKLDYLMSQVKIIANRLNNFSFERGDPHAFLNENQFNRLLSETISEVLQQHGYMGYRSTTDKDNNINIYLKTLPSILKQKQIIKAIKTSPFAKGFNFQLDVDKKDI
jgi:hypothetical protein